MSILDYLKNPPNQYRPVPFWSWNDKLEPEELRRQIQEMKKSGVGGYFMHARDGLETPYMSSEWMDCVAACVDEGNKLGLDTWFYDEDRWPSGSASKTIPAKGEAYEKKWLIYETVDKKNLKTYEKTLGVYKKQENRYIKINPQDAKGNVLHVYYFTTKGNSDILDPMVTQAFIQSTHQKYYQRFKNHIGKTIPGIFTDEAQYSIGYIPWSLIMQEEFKKENGYDIVEVLPALYYETEGYKKVRYDFWKVVARLFVESFGKEIGDWCEAHKLKFTGHIMHENDLLTQVMAVGDAMAFYEYMQLPGVDWLNRMIGPPIVPKQVSSVAHQLGKKQVLCEAFACMGWDVTLEDYKWVADWLHVHGINFICQHLQAYSLRGRRKRDFPPSHFYQQPWWNEYKYLQDYLARLGMLLANGRNIAEILVIHPIRSAWVNYNTRDHSAVQFYNRKFISLSSILCNMHFAYDYGNERLMAKYARVEDNELKIGQASYKVVIIPPSCTLAQTTVELLEKFLNNGGTVISIDEFPNLMDGMESDAMKSLEQRVKHAKLDCECIKDILMKTIDPAIAITEKGCGSEAESVYYYQTEIEGKFLYFLTNINRQRTTETEVTIFTRGKVESINLETGEITPLKSGERNGYPLLHLTFEPMQSYVIMLTPGQESPMDTGDEPCLVFEEKLNDEWEIKDRSLNAITLDNCRLKIENGQWSAPQPILWIQSQLQNQKRDAEIQLEFKLNIGFDPRKLPEWYLVVEQAHEFIIEINGQRVNREPLGWWVDISFKKIDIHEFLTQGENTIILKRLFNKTTELESIYVVGDFDVLSDKKYTECEWRALLTEGAFTLVEKRQKVHTGDLVVQGMPFFTGRITLSQTFKSDDPGKYKRISFNLPRPDASVSKLWINGHLVKVFAWAPYEAEIQNYLKEGDNQIDIELVSGCRNLLGPHHDPKGRGTTVNPSDFLISDLHYAFSYCFSRFGLNKDLIIRFHR